MTEKICIRNAKFAKIGLQDLINYIGDTSDMVMVEVGSFVGDSTQIFARNFKTVHCVDPWENGYDDEMDPSSYTWPMSQVEAQFDELCQEFPNIIKHKMPSERGADLFEDESLDFVYIDGNHKYEFVKIDIESWFPKIKKTGWIGGHDYQHKWAPGVKPAVDEILGEPDARFRETSWIKKI